MVSSPKSPPFTPCGLELRKYVLMNKYLIISYAKDVIRVLKHFGKKEISLRRRHLDCTPKDRERPAVGYRTAQAEGAA